MASVLALFLLSPVHLQSLPQEPSTITFVQGNYILANNVPPIEQPTTYLDILGKNPRCPLSSQCVYYVRNIKGINFGTGNANQIEPNTYLPCEKCAVFFWGGKYGHVAYVEKIFGDEMFISEMNVEGCGVISSRWISINSPSIKGYYNP